MRYLIRDIPAFLRSPAGRIELGQACLRASWPVLAPIAAIHRRGLGRFTKLITVVGSYGKTTTTKAIAHALGMGRAKHQHENCLGYLACNVVCCTPFQPHRVLEVGISKPGQMRAYAKVFRPDIAVVTSIGTEHHRSLGNLETTRAEKSEIVACLPSDGLAVLNGDDPHVRWMRERARSRIVTFGFSPACDIRATSATLDWPHGMRFEVQTPRGAATGRVRWLGTHMIYPALAAIAVGLDQGVPLDTILARLAEIPPVPGRLQLVRSPAGVYLLRDEFKSSLETIHSALDALESIPLPAAQKLVVLGEISEPPGSQGPLYRTLGERIARIASFAVCLGGNSKRYAHGFRLGGWSSNQFANAGRSVAKAASMIRARARPGDVVLIKGRDNQRLARVSLSLLGRNVQCGLELCLFGNMDCDDCPALEIPSPASPPPWACRTGMRDSSNT